MLGYIKSLITKKKSGEMKNTLKEIGKDFLGRPRLSFRCRKCKKYCVAGLLDYKEDIANICPVCCNGKD